MVELSRLPGPTAGRWSWQMQAACVGLDARVFFPLDGERGEQRAAREAAAKAICARCVVIRECARHALTVREPYGVWGGMSQADREARLGRVAAGAGTPRSSSVGRRR